MNNDVFVDDEKVLKRLNNIKNLDLYKAMMTSVSLMERTAMNKLQGFKHSNGDLKKCFNPPNVYEIGDEIVGELSNYSDHAIFVEFGTGTVGNGTYPYSASETGVNLTYSDKPYWRYQDADGNWHTTSGMVAHPFMYPAYKENEKKIKELIQKDVKATITSKI